MHHVALLGLHVLCKRALDYSLLENLRRETLGECLSIDHDFLLQVHSELLVKPILLVCLLVLAKLLKSHFLLAPLFLVGTQLGYLFVELPLRYLRSRCCFFLDVPPLL